MPGLDMPSFRDESDTQYVWTWDATSHTYVKVPSGQASPNNPERSNATGGDNNLFDPATITEWQDNPLREGILAASVNPNECPSCHGLLNTEGACSACGTDPFNDAKPMYTQTAPFPDRTPKPNNLKTDLSYPSMLSKTANDALWDEVLQGPITNEVGKFIVDAAGNLHYEPGARSDFARLKKRDHISEPSLYGAVTTDGKATIQDVAAHFQPDTQAIEKQLSEAFGTPITLAYDKSQATSPLNSDMADTNDFQTFAHIDEELEFLARHPASLDSCPECNDVLFDGDGAKECRNCGHKQPVIDTTLGKYIAGLIEEGLGAAAGGLIGGPIGGALGGDVGALMGRALGRGVGYSAMKPGGGAPAAAAFPDEDPTPPEPEAVVSHLLDAGVIDHYAAGAFGTEEVGVANKNMGLDHNPANKEQQGFNEEHGDSPELLKDVNDAGGSREGDEKVEGGEAHQQHALKMFETMKPIIIEYANDDTKSGYDNPLIKALDDLLEQAFPGYKGEGHDATHSPADENDHSAPEAAESDSEGTEEEDGGSDKGKPKESATGPYGEDYAHGNDELYGGVPAGYEHQQQQPTQEPYVCPNCNFGTHDNIYNCPKCGEELVDHDPHGYEPDQDEYTGPGEYEMYGPDKPRLEDFVSNIPNEHLAWMTNQPSVPGGAPTQMAPPTAPAPVPGAAVQNGVAPCPACGQPHPPGTACNPNPTGGMVNTTPPTTQPNGMLQQQVITKWHIAEDLGGGESPKPKHTPTDGAGDTFDHDHGQGQHPGHDWTDENGQPLQEGQAYELLSPNYAIPDKITVDRILPDKLVFTVKADLMDYQDEMTKEDLTNEGYTFSPTMQAPDSNDGFQDQQENPVRPGMDSGAQVDDLSTPPTTVSKTNPELDWLWDEGGNSEAQSYDQVYGMTGDFGVGKGSRTLPEPHYAGKDYSPREQREFIDEGGTARNVDRMDLSGTHYVDDPEIDDAFLW